MYCCTGVATTPSLLWSSKWRSHTDPTAVCHISDHITAVLLYTYLYIYSSSECSHVANSSCGLRFDTTAAAAVAPHYTDHVVVSLINDTAVCYVAAPVYRVYITDPTILPQHTNSQQHQNAGGWKRGMVKNGTALLLSLLT